MPLLAKTVHAPCEGFKTETDDRIHDNTPRLATQGVLGTIIVNEEGEAVRATTLCDASGAPVEDQSGAVAKFSSLVPQLASMARNMVRDLDPQNDLRFLRVRSRDHEMMVHADPEFTLIVIQNPAAAE